MRSRIGWTCRIASTILDNTQVGREREGRAKLKLRGILEQGAQEYDYLRTLVFDNETVDYMLEHAGTLFDYLIKEKRASEQKYEKLLELHNNLIESNTASEERYSAEYIYKLADENEYLKNELNRVLANKTGFEARSNSVTPTVVGGNTTTAFTQKDISSCVSEKMQERIDRLERKLSTIERDRTRARSILRARNNHGIDLSRTESRTKRPAVGERYALRRKSRQAGVN